MRKELVLLLSLAGCIVGCNLQHEQLARQNTRIEKKNICLEEQLLADAADGRINMSIERAALIAGGCIDPMVDFYEKRFETVLDEITEGINGDDLEKAFSVSRRISDGFIFTDREFRFEYLLNPGIRKGNCVLHSILLKQVLDRLEVKSGLIANRTHQFNYIDFDDKRIYLDSTSPETGFTADDSDIRDEYTHEVSKEEAVSNIYAIRATVLDSSRECQGSRYTV